MTCAEEPLDSTSPWPRSRYLFGFRERITYNLHHNLRKAQPMKCPSCSNQLTSKVINKISLDVCDNGCGGIWFDQFELKKFDEKFEPDAEGLLDIKISTNVSKNTTKVHDCPKCINIKMMRHFASTKRKVTVDQCAQCAGFWLDAGELTEIRNEFESEADRHKAAEKLFSEMFDSKLSEEREKSAAQYEKMQSIAKAFRFVTPSYYTKAKK